MAGRPKSTEVVALSDTQHTSYSNFKTLLNYMHPDVRDAIMNREMDRATIQRINTSISSIQSGIWSTFPMICAGEKCPYQERCPLYAEDMAPVGDECPLEQTLLYTWLDEYCVDLMVDTDNKVELDQVGTIVMCDLMMMRINNWMARRPDSHIELNATGVDRNGNIAISRDISKEIQLIEKYQRIKNRNLESLLATRESKAKYDVIDDTNPGVASAKLKAKADELLNKKMNDAIRQHEKTNAKAALLEKIARDSGLIEIHREE